MEEEKIDRILKLVDMLEVTDKNRDDIAKIKKLIEQKKYAEMLELLKKVTNKSETKVKEENESIVLKKKEEPVQEKEELELKIDQTEEEKEKANLEKLMEKLEQEKEEEDYEYPSKLSNKGLEETYISLLLANPKAISMYYIEKNDCYFENALLLNIYKSILFTEGEAYAPQIAKDGFNYAKENYKIFQSKKRLLEKGKESRKNFEKVYVELRKLFEIRKGYTTSPIKETQKQIEEIVDYELYDRMTIQEVKDAIVQITTTEKFKRSVLSNNMTDFLLSGENNLNSGLSLPFPILSSVFKGIRKGETMSYAMPSNSGKSRFTIDIAAYIAYKHKKKVLIVSNEMSEEKMKLCLITTIVNNEEIQKLHGYKIRITEGVLGKVIDIGFTNPLDFGRCMAPAALEVLFEYFSKTKKTPKDFDLILTGDLSKYGYEIVKKELEKEFKYSDNYNDCGLMIYDIEHQHVNAGGSGPGCSSGVVLSYVKKEMLKGKLKKVLVVSTGALLNPNIVLENESIPSIAHLFVMESVL